MSDKPETYRIAVTETYDVLVQTDKGADDAASVARRFVAGQLQPSPGLWVAHGISRHDFGPAQILRPSFGLVESRAPECAGAAPVISLSDHVVAGREAERRHRERGD